MFWDSSALVPVLLPEGRSKVLTALLTTDKETVIWWATPLECQSAIDRRNREVPVPALGSAARQAGKDSFWRRDAGTARPVV